MRAILYLLACFCLCSSRGEAEDCSRIVSTAPSVSEVIATLGLRNNIVGVTRFDPLLRAESSGITKLREIGGFLDLNRELVTSLNSSLVLGLDESQEILRSLSRLGQRVELFDHRSLLGINQSVVRLGKLCGKTQFADTWGEGVATLIRRLKQQLNRSLSASARRGVVVISSGGGTGFYLSGGDGYYSHLLIQLGLDNVYSKRTQAMGDISAEGIIALAPQFIIEIVEPGSLPSLEGYLSSSLGSLSQRVPAIREGKIVSIGDQYASIPGPISYPLLAQSIAKNLLGK